MAKEQELERLYHRLALDLRSTIHKPANGEASKCKVRFHNCTPYRVTPFWIDFKGLPIKYSPLPRGASINIDTYESHLWFFKAQDTDNVNGTTNSHRHDIIKLLAIPEETLDMGGGLSHLKSYFRDQMTLTDPDSVNDSMATQRNSGVQSAILGLGNVLICSLCKYIVKHYSKDPIKVPCPHFTGEAKFSISDIICRSWSRFNPTYIYSCTSKTHRRDHSQERRDIYLVEPFYNLRERCFLALRNHIRHSDLSEMNLPISLQEEYLQFMTTLKKVNESNVST